jgi:hypothetical protein
MTDKSTRWKMESAATAAGSAGPRENDDGFPLCKSEILAGDRRWRDVPPVLTIIPCEEMVG